MQINKYKIIRLVCLVLLILLAVFSILYGHLIEVMIGVVIGIILAWKFKWNQLRNFIDSEHHLLIQWMWENETDRFSTSIYIYDCFCIGIHNLD